MGKTGKMKFFCWECKSIISKPSTEIKEDKEYTYHYLCQTCYDKLIKEGWSKQGIMSLISDLRISEYLKYEDKLN